MNKSVRGGAWVFVCGPSGAGKDSVIGWAAATLASQQRITFSRRTVTRRAGPGADDEAVAAAEFAQRLAAGRFAWHWHAHGIDYGVDHAYAGDVESGQVVVVNGSREHVAGLDRGDAGLHVVLVTAAADLVAARLRNRGRDDAAAVNSRIARNAALPSPQVDLVIGNDGALPDAGQRLAAYLRGLAD